jgi:hypothetical protein
LTEIDSETVEKVCERGNEICVTVFVDYLQVNKQDAALQNVSSVYNLNKTVA